MQWIYDLVESGRAPDPLIRLGIRHQLGQRLRQLGSVETLALIDHMRSAPVALHAADANEQHYELPAEFFRLVLGPRLKYSCCFWPEEVDSLAAAEEAALEQACRRAAIADGMDILELGCGWGSLSLWMAERYPASRIVAVSNSGAQRRFIESAAKDRGTQNLEEHRLGVYVLDVSGHGVPAALLSVALTHWLTPTPGHSFLFTRRPMAAGGACYEVASPVDVVDRLNRKFPMDHRSPQYFTMLYGVLDTRILELRYVAAGNPPPVHMPRHSRAAALEAHGFPVGMVAEPAYSENVLRLEPGDRLYWYTDGLTEAGDANGQELGIDGLVTELERVRGLPLEESVAAALARAERWTGSESFHDDVSILAIET